MKQAAGCVLIAGSKILICHSRRSIEPLKDWNDEHWSIPKGIIEPNEIPEQTMGRELFEETGINWRDYYETPQIQPRRFNFMVGHNKFVHGFSIRVSEDILGHSLKCSSLVTTDCPWKNLSEMDNFMWALPPECYEKVFVSQKNLFIPPVLDEIMRKIPV